VCGVDAPVAHVGEQAIGAVAPEGENPVPGVGVPLCASLAEPRTVAVGVAGEVVRRPVHVG
jgi:hypothetical protein